MKSIVLFYSAIIFFSTTSSAQNSSGQSTTGKPYTIHVFNKDGSVLKGYLYEASPTGITVTKSTKEPVGSATITPEQINKLYLRKKNNIGVGIILGAIGGAAIGAVIGAASPDDEAGSWGPGSTTQEKTIAGATIGCLSGAGLGAIIGALTKKKFMILGKRESYQMAYPAIVERAMIQLQ